MKTLFVYFDKKENKYNVFNPYVNDKVHTQEQLDENNVYITWKRIDNFSGRQYVLSEIADMENIDVQDLWFYCGSPKHDELYATYKAYYNLSEGIKERVRLSKIFKTDLTNLSDIKVADVIYRKLYGEIVEPQNKDYVFDIQEVIHPLARKLSFFNEYGKNYGMYSKQTWKNIELNVCGIDINLSTGGIHGVEKGVHICEPYEVIYSFDVKNFYASISTQFGLYPQHLNDKKFFAMYKSLLNNRDKFNTHLSKFLITALYGKISKENYWLYDKKVSMGITINGQILIMSMIMDICNSVVGAVPLMINTDGFEIRAGKDKEQQIEEIISVYESYYNITIKRNKYSKLIASSVNDYIAVGEVVKSNEDIIVAQNTDFTQTLGGKNFYAPVILRGKYRIISDDFRTIQCPNARMMVLEHYLYGFIPGEYQNKYHRYMSPSRELNDDECITLAKSTISNLQKPIDLEQLKLF